MPVTAFQLKITLEDVRPLIWRRVLVPPDLTFAELHEVIQAAMGWRRLHLFQFAMLHHEISASALISSHFQGERDYLSYVYDLGDDWVHSVELEKTRTARITVPQLPWLLAGARACPPEDSGGPWSYMELVRRKKSRQRSVLPRGFDPAQFDRDALNQAMPALRKPEAKSSAVKFYAPHFRGLIANPQTLGVTPLADGEESRSVRVRGSRELHAWLRTQGAAKLGEHLEAVMLAEQKKGQKR